MCWRFEHRYANHCLSLGALADLLLQNMKESKDRTEQFMYSTATAANHAPASTFIAVRQVHISHQRYLDSYLFSSTQRQDPMGDGSSGRYDAKGKGRATPNGDMLALDLDHAEEGAGGQNGGGAFMQMQLVEQQVCISRLVCLRFTFNRAPILPRITTYNRGRPPSNL